MSTEEGKIVFTEVFNDFIEVHGGWKNWFRPLSNLGRSQNSVAISVTSNANGFTPLTAVARHFSLDSNLIRENAHQCQDSMTPHLLKTNINGEDSCCPVNLIFVPKLKTIELCGFIFDDLVSLCVSNNISLLHLTHFCFMQTNRGMKQLDSILQHILKQSTRTDSIKFVFDLDSRYHDGFLARNQHGIFRKTDTVISVTNNGDLLRSQSLNEYLESIQSQNRIRWSMQDSKEILHERLDHAQSVKMMYLDKLKMIDQRIKSLNEEILTNDT